MPLKKRPKAEVDDSRFSSYFGRGHFERARKAWRAGGSLHWRSDKFTVAKIKEYLNTLFAISQIA